MMEDLNKNKSEQEKNAANNDPADYGDDTIGENTELTPVAKEILKEQDDKKVEAKDNQENKDFSEKNG